LKPDQKIQLLQLARSAIASYLKIGRLPEALTEETALNQAAGVFVTLRERRRSGLSEGRLRGCVGRMETEQPLYKIVQEMAVKAAIADPRFPPLMLEELPEMRIEVSVLSQPRPVSKISEIEIGRDGLLIEHRGRRGVLLPKVASSRNWNQVQFLKQVCRKAGLADDSLTRGARLYRFSAVDFAEDD
jgi:AmmeMemoRadiSam system protein A